ncbi:hypothetical protein JQ543_28535 [Bradyrhizobium diazoefficiens]|nr:hypothetical protein [Bradyrhizobium diazoefficiens]MBR0851717.1 hypothetical protein [Bradyrhizobium diazoefficiens]
MSQDYVTIQDAIIAMGVEEAVLAPFIADLVRTNRIDVKVVDGERRFLFDTLLELQRQDPTFGGRKTVEPQIAAPASLARRKFIEGVIVGYVATLLAEPLKIQLKEVVDKRKDAADALDLFDELFGCVDDNWSFDLGKIYPSGGHHGDHEVTRDAILRSRPSLTSVRSAIISRSPLLLPVTGDHLVIGGPVSTPVVRRAWQYENVGGRADHFKRVEKPLLHLPYGFLVDDGDRRNKNLPPVAWRMAGNSVAVKAANRVLLNSDNPRDQHFAAASRDHVEFGQERVAVPNTNDLLITRLPNFLSSSYKADRATHPGAWGRLVVVQGTHGIGTRAVQLLLTDKGKAPLLAMKAQVSNAQAFQSHFKVSKPEVTQGGFHRFTNIEHVRSVPLEIPRRNYAALRLVLEREFSVLR